MKRRGGSVLILAVWVLFFLTALAVAIGSQVGAMLSLAGFVRDHVALRALGQAAAMQSAAVISGQTNAWDGITDASWTRDAAVFTIETLPGGTVRTGFVVRDERSAVTNTGVLSETGRINLNEANERLLTAYFRVAGRLSSIEAEDLAKAVRARIGGGDAPRTGTTGDAQAAAGSSKPSQSVRPFMMIEELRGLRGIEGDLFRLLAPGLTVVGDGLINVNSSSSSVLESLALAVTDDPDMARLLAEWLVRFIEEANGFESMDAIRDAVDAANVPSGWKPSFRAMTRHLTVASTHFRGITYVNLVGTTRETAAQEFVFDNREKRFVYWREF